MDLSTKAKNIISDISGENTKMGDLKKIGKEIKKDHDLALELWSAGGYHPRLLASLIFDKKLLTQEVIDQLASDILEHDQIERNQLTDWLLANQLTKDKKTIALMTTWEHNDSPILRHLFWYYQARLRWAGKTPPENSAELLDSLEQDLAAAEPGVQWAMNFCACQIGLNEPELRSRCIDLGERIGLYKDDPVARNCAPAYLPGFIEFELAKRQK